MRLHILTPGFTTPNGRAFLFPFVAFRWALFEAGIYCKRFNKVTPKLYDCDVLLVDSKFHKFRWEDSTPSVINEFAQFREKIPTVIYCDTTDSTGWVQTELLPLVDCYAKAQLLKERKDYLYPLYGHRPFTDWAHRRYGIHDACPEYSTAVPDPAWLKKLALSWNSGLANYSLLGPTMMGAYARVPFPLLLQTPSRFTTPDNYRSIHVHARMGVQYERATVSFQRREITRRLSKRLMTDKVNRFQYWQELKKSRLVISPFGLGEITLKDYEVFLTGGCLLKPEMSGIETWPNLFQADRTMVPFRWDLADLEEVVEQLLEEPDKARAIAENGQNNYRRHIEGDQAGQIFVEHLQDLIRYAGKRG